MADLDPIVQPVRIDASDAEEALNNLAATGAEAFAKIAEAASSGDFTGLATMLGGPVAGAITKIVELTIEWIDTSAQAVAATAAVGEAFGTTYSQTQELATGFAAVGVTGEQLQRAMQRTASEIARSWSTIEQNAREAPVKEEAAAEHIVDANQRIADAKNKAASTSGEWANKLTADALSVQQAWINLSFAVEEMAEKMTRGFQSVSSASTSVKEAQLHLDELQSGEQDPSKDQGFADREKAIQLEKAKQGVSQAEERQREAETSANKTAQTSAMEIPQAQLRVAEAQLKAQEDTREAAYASAKADEDIAKAITGLKEAVNAAFNAMLHDLDNVASALKSGNAQTLAQVSPTEIFRSIEKLAGQDYAGGGAPTGLQTMAETQKLMQQPGGAGLSYAQNTALMQQFGFTGRGGSPTSAEALKAFQTGSPLDLQKLAAEKPTAAQTKSDQELVAQAQGIVANTALTNSLLTQIKDELGVKAGDALAKGGNTFISQLLSAFGGLFGGHAGGGVVHGPGTGTSDSIPAYLSHGEYVVRAAAVQKYGSKMFDALNDMKVGGFAFGGIVSSPAPIRMADGGVATSPSVLNLTIGNEQFNGLSAPAHIANKLKQYAVSQQMEMAGSRPSWDR